MRKLLIDTDVGGDDAVALIMALREPTVHVEAITTVMGNVPVEQATKNALVTIERAGSYAPPVYQGLSNGVWNQPLVGKDYTIHGHDGMGDLGLPQPKGKPQREHAVDFLIRTIEENPDTYEMVTLGPVTNLAWISLRSPGTLTKLRSITMMMGTGLYLGNATPMAEGNARMDPEALDIVLRDSGAKLTMVGWDLCIRQYLFRQKELDQLRNSGSALAQFCLDINHNLIELNQQRMGEAVIDMADPVAMAVALEPSLVLDALSAYVRAETSHTLAYGALSIDHMGQSGQQPNARVCTRLDAEAVKDYIIRHIL